MKALSPCRTIDGGSSLSCSSSISPTICSTMSSIETSPSVPYSSTTSARWMREACICASRSIARIDGGTNSSLRMMLASASGNARSTARRSRPAGTASCAWAWWCRRPRLRGHERQQVADVNDAFGVVERFVVDHEPRMRRARTGSSVRRAEYPASPRRCRRGAPSRRRSAARSGRGCCAAWCARWRRSRHRPGRRRARPEDRRGPSPPSSRTACGSRAAASCRRPGAAPRLPSPPPAGWACRAGCPVSGRVRHFSPPLPVRIADRECRAARESPVRDFHGFGVVVFSWSYPIKCRKPWTARWLR